MQNFKPEMIDYRYAPGDPTPALEVVLKEDGKVVWVNFMGVCVFRGCNLPDDLIVEIKGMLLDTQKRHPNKTGWMWVGDDGSLGSIVYDTPAQTASLKQWRKPVEVFIVEDQVFKRPDNEQPLPTTKGD